MIDAEILGYLASFTVALSLLMSNVKRLRVLNMTGCVLFVIYGLYISAYPVVLLNGLCVFINIYHLFKLSRSAPVEAQA